MRLEFYRSPVRERAWRRYPIFSLAVTLCPSLWIYFEIDTRKYFRTLALYWGKADVDDYLEEKK